VSLRHVFRPRLAGRSGIGPEKPNPEKAIPMTLRHPMCPPVDPTRRRFLTQAAGGLVALPIVSVAIASPDSSFAGQDLELQSLAAQIKKLREESIPGATAEHDRCYEIYKSLCPQRSRTLIWQVGDDCGYSSKKFVDGDGKTYLWCDFVGIEKLRTRTSFAEWYFTGSEEEWVKLGLPNWRDNRIMPVKGYQHLFASYGDERREKRAKELVAASDEYNAGCNNAELESGFKAAAAALDDIYELIDDLFERMLKLKPTTLEGFRAMATGVFHRCCLDEVETGDSPEDLMFAAMVRGLMAIEPLEVNRG
jgi:hypothetical protein